MSSTGFLPRSLLQTIMDSVESNPPAQELQKIWPHPYPPSILDQIIHGGGLTWSPPLPTPYVSTFPPNITGGQLLAVPLVQNTSPAGTASVSQSSVPAWSMPLSDKAVPPVNAQQISASGKSDSDDPRSVHSLTSGKVTVADWQNPNDQNSGLGWRVWITDDKGNRTGYGHMDPSSTPPIGAVINRGDKLGVYANPTNGSSTAPHVHVQSYDRFGNPVDPGMVSPLTGGRMTTPYHGRDGITHRMEHNGVDWAAPR
jgi:hypothetical protein